MYNYFIGVDCGVNMGFAVWNSTTKKFKELSTYTFWAAIQRIEQLHKESIENCFKTTIVIEDVTKNSPTFFSNKIYQNTQGNHNQKLGAVCKKAERVGTVKDKTQLLINYCIFKNIPTILQVPKKSSLTKLSSEQFFSLTKCSIQTNEHVRDAAMLVFGR